MTDTQELKPCREAFEEWHSNRFEQHLPSIRTGAGYYSGTVQIRWVAWEAAWEARYYVSKYDDASSSIRGDFERWVSDFLPTRGGNPRIALQMFRGQSQTKPEQNYADQRTETAWLAWRAARTTPPSERGAENTSGAHKTTLEMQAGYVETTHIGYSLHELGLQKEREKVQALVDASERLLNACAAKHPSLKDDLRKALAALEKGCSNE